MLLACKQQFSAAAPVSYCPQRFGVWLCPNRLSAQINIKTGAFLTQVWLLGAKQSKANCQDFSSACLSHTIKRQGSSPKQDGAQRAASNKAMICAWLTDLLASKARALQRLAMVSLIGTAVLAVFCMVYLLSI